MSTRGGTGQQTARARSGYAPGEFESIQYGAAMARGDYDVAARWSVRLGDAERFDRARGSADGRARLRGAKGVSGKAMVAEIEKLTPPRGTAARTPAVSAPRMTPAAAYTLARKEYDAPTLSRARKGETSAQKAERLTTDVAVIDKWFAANRAAGRTPSAQAQDAVTHKRESLSKQVDKLTSTAAKVTRTPGAQAAKATASKAPRSAAASRARADAYQTEVTTWARDARRAYPGLTWRQITERNPQLGREYQQRIGRLVALRTKAKQALEAEAGTQAMARAAGGA